MKLSILSLAPIYKKDSHGNIRKMTLQVKDNAVRAVSGVIGGATQFAEWVAYNGCNKGKANEKSPHAHAIFKAKAKREKLLDYGGFFPSVQAISTMPKKLKPMFAHAFNAKKHAKCFPVFVQPKLNGIRCLISKTQFITRNGKKIVSCPHIRKALEPYFAKYPDAIIDGELYNHDLRFLLDKINSLVRKQKPTSEDLTESEKLIQLHTYDCVDDRPFDLRHPEHIRKLNETLVATGTGITPIRKVLTIIVRSQAELDAFYHKLLRDGYEGAIIRFFGLIYEQSKRSGQMLKYKPRWTDEFRIVECMHGKGKDADILSSVLCEVTRTRKVEGGWPVTKGTRFKANTKGKQEVNRELWLKRKSILGRKATISYAYITKDGKLFHPYLEKIWFESKI